MSNPSTTTNPSVDLKATLTSIQPKNTLLNASITATVCKSVREKFDGVDLAMHKTDPNLILYVCDLIETAFSESKTKKVDKKREVMKCMKTLIPTITASEEESILNIIEFLHSTEQIRRIEEQIKKVVRPILKRAISVFRSVASI